ncbi:MAG: hypothetical protein HY289_05490 [Planctomycetes bacterium]|nr:hypothetical protein [Planctomycetota bacterium]
MQAIHTIETVTGPTLSIAVPVELKGTKVEVVVTPIDDPQESLEQARARKIRELTMEIPKLSPELVKQLAANPNLLEGSVIHYEGPFGPACPLEDWEALS